MSNAGYQDKAFEIISSSIKSAVFIDDKALPFYFSGQPSGEYEEELSKSLFDNFKEMGVSLAVHRFAKGDEHNGKLKKYLLEDRDLVLLDWNLEGSEGTDYSLKLISEIVKKPNIHFCVIYTSTPNINEVFSQVSCYFSGKTIDHFNEIKEELDAYEDELMPLLESVDVLNEKSINRQISQLIEIDNGLIDLIKKSTGQKDIKKGLILVKFAYGNWYKSEIPLPKPTVLSPGSQTLVIHNTVITILKKDDQKNYLTDSSGLIRRLSDQLTESENSFTQLLGFEMQSLFSRSSSFVDANLLKVSREALLSHRNQMFQNEEDDTSFKLLIKNLLIEHASLSLRNSKLELLKDDFLKEQSDMINEVPSDKDLQSMNVFYNSIKIKNSADGSIKTLNFGDVFIGDDNRYYICITALCDCYRPTKIENNYYFAIGQPIDMDKALRMGDTAFISYLPGEKVISWVGPESVDAVSTEAVNIDTEEDLTEEQAEIRRLKTELDIKTLENEQFRQFIYKPVYIKPIQFHVKNHKLVDDKIQIHRIVTNKKESENLKIIDLDYVTSIRPNYAQRIANHAFNHPLRVGVDFAKKQ